MDDPLRSPYLLFIADCVDPSDAKTAMGLRDWCPDRVMGQCRLPGATLDLGLPDLDPKQAAERGAGSMVIGIAPMGGRLAPSWRDSVIAALDAGLDVISGLHARLDDDPEIAAAAQRGGGQVRNVRHTHQSFMPGTGEKRPGLRVLTVGTDCALGKKYTALAITKELQARGMKATFRATGQTGLMIAGRGVAIDAVVADFISGAAEWLSPANDPDHWDVIEGQGSLHNPSYAGVSLGLLHGSQPDALVLCHHANRQHMTDLPHVPMPDPLDAIDLAERLARRTNPAARCVGITVNTSTVDERKGREIMDRLAEASGLPVCDPIKGGVGPIADALQHWPTAGSPSALAAGAAR